MKFRNPKTGEVFEDISDALESAYQCWDCPGIGGCPIGRKAMNYNMDCCSVVEKHAEKAARLMGYEVVEDEKEDSMFYSQSLEVLNPAKAIREAKEKETGKMECPVCGKEVDIRLKEANMDKPRICEVLGVEVGETFSIDGYPTDYGMVQVCEDGKIRRVISSVEFPFAKDGEVGHKIGSNVLYYLLNHPDSIIRKPRWTEQEVERAKAIKVLYPEAESLDECDPQVKVLNTKFVIATLDTALFPSLRLGESVTLDEIIGGAE